MDVNSIFPSLVQIVTSLDQVITNVEVLEKKIEANVQQTRLFEALYNELEPLENRTQVAIEEKQLVENQLQVNKLFKIINLRSSRCELVL